MEKETLVWNKVLATVLKMPGVKVDRIAFLRTELRPYCNQSRLQMIGSVRPYTVVSEQVVDKLAKQCVHYHTALATATSTIAGLPGGLVMAATLPADLVQYFYHVFVLSQKLAYLYGYPDLCEEDGELSDMASDLLTIFMGVMVGAPVAEKGINELSKAVAENAVTRLPRVALTKTAIVPIAAQIARLIGTRISKEGCRISFSYVEIALLLTPMSLATCSWRSPFLSRSSLSRFEKFAIMVRYLSLHSKNSEKALPFGRFHLPYCKLAEIQDCNRRPYYDLPK